MFFLCLHFIVGAIQLTMYFVFFRRVIIVLEFSLVGKASETIGNPQPFRSGGQQAGDGGNDGMKPTATSSTETSKILC